jgi:hypothetical protein
MGLLRVPIRLWHVSVPTENENIAPATERTLDWILKEFYFTRLSVCLFHLPVPINRQATPPTTTVGNLSLTNRLIHLMMQPSSNRRLNAASNPDLHACVTGHLRGDGDRRCAGSSSRDIRTSQHSSGPRFVLPL